MQAVCTFVFATASERHMRALLNIIKNRVIMSTETDKIILHMAQSNYAHILPALSAHHFTGQQFPLQIPAQNIGV